MKVCQVLKYWHLTSYVDFNIPAFGSVVIFLDSDERYFSINFDVTRDLDSPDADITLPAEYSVTNINTNESTFTITDTTNIPTGTKITVIRRVGRVWNEIIDENTTKTLSQTDNRIGNFLREKEVTLPQ